MYTYIFNLGNFIEEEGSKAITNVLKTNTSLTVLDLDKTPKHLQYFSNINFHIP